MDIDVSVGLVMDCPRCKCRFNVTTCKPIFCPDCRYNMGQIMAVSLNNTVSIPTKEGE